MGKALACVAMAVAFATASEAAEPRYDHKLEKAAAQIVAARMGDIRGGFSFREKPQFVAAHEPSTHSLARASSDPVKDDSLVPAVEGALVN